MMAVIPDWLEPFRLVGTLLLWVIVPLQLYALHHGRRLHQRWEEAERARTARWQKDMEDAEKLRDEATHLRHQAEISLAMARRQVLSAPRREEAE
jgi:F0F1-type ATP synthase membrane subunit b/b'